MESNQNILFVDNDSRLLRGLQRALGNQVGFGLFFAEKGAGAFDIIRNNKIDFVVSGTKAGDMSGKMLLERVRSLKPDSIRVMFSSGETECINESDFEGANLVHRYISRPCNSNGLLNILKKMGERWCYLPIAQRIRVVGAQSPALLPETADYLITNSYSSEIDKTELINILTGDPGFICWAVFTRRYQIESMKYLTLTDLVSRFVNDGILLHKGVLNRQMIRTYSDKRLLRYQRMVYDHCLETSSLAGEIARGIYGDGNVVISQAILAGLLHDIGKLILAEQYLRQDQTGVKNVAIEEIKSIESERKTYGIDHCQFAAMLYSLWGVPDDIIDAVSEHHQPATDLDGGCLKNILKTADLHACLKSDVLSI